MADEKEREKRREFYSKLAYVEVLPSALARLLKPSEVFRVESGLPDDAEFITAEFGDFGRVIRCLFKSESFEAVPEGHPVPRLELVTIRGFAAGFTSEGVAYLRELADMFDNAGRIGAALEDAPEGSLRVELSDTLARKISKRLREILQQDA